MTTNLVISFCGNFRNRGRKTEKRGEGVGVRQKLFLSAYHHNFSNFLSQEVEELVEGKGREKKKKFWIESLDLESW